MSIQAKWSLMLLGICVFGSNSVHADDDCVGMNCSKSSLGQEQDLPQPKLTPLEDSVRQQKLKAMLHGTIEPDSEKSPKEVPLKVLKSRNQKHTHKKEQRAQKLQVSAKSDLGVEGNLPKYLAQVERKDYQLTAELSIDPEKKIYDKFSGIRAGDRIDAVIEDSLKVSTNSPVPVVAEILSGRFKGGVFLGEATLEGDLKRIRVDFKSLRLPKSNQMLSLLATAMRSEGEYALEGDFTASDTKYLVGQIVTGAAAGFVGAGLDRTQPVAGPYYETPNLANAGKDALIGGLAETAKRMGERATQTPGYTTMKGPIEIQVLVLEDPIQKDPS